LQGSASFAQAIRSLKVVRLNNYPETQQTPPDEAETITPANNMNTVNEVSNYGSPALGEGVIAAIAEALRDR